ncbi:HAD family hydrolase [Streptomyces phytophilus]|uniref:HAD family hydrolase n=1 Tax=Streptomyces phytophilus TaxID=722715 RepID=UPI0015EFE791|nr:HAD family hydrolase [Streptomyces phytophilus]
MPQPSTIHVEDDAGRRHNGLARSIEAIARECTLLVENITDLPLLHRGKGHRERLFTTEIQELAPSVGHRRAVRKQQQKLHSREGGFGLWPGSQTILSAWGGTEILILPKGLRHAGFCNDDSRLHLAMAHELPWSTDGNFSAVILDLFGTLVAAPTVVERGAAAAQFADVLGVPSKAVETALSGSWRARHGGQLRSTAEVAAYLVARCEAPSFRAYELERLMGRLARERLQADASLLRALVELRQRGLRLGVLSDASPDIAETWRHSCLFPLFDAAVFSCRVGEVKPAPALFDAVLGALDVPPAQILYCGDGGGDELAGAERAGMQAVRVERRGEPDALAFGETAWHGRAILGVEALPRLLNTRSPQ